jgi:hypothetical protein
LCRSKDFIDRRVSNQQTVDLARSASSLGQPKFDEQFDLSPTNDLSRMNDRGAFFKPGADWRVGSVEKNS